MLSKQKILILGAGKSGLAAAKLLQIRGESFLISSSQKPNQEIIRLCKDRSYPLHIGKQSSELLINTSKIIVSPGIPNDIYILKQARINEIPIISEIDLALSAYERPWVAITGTNGKSTCTEWLTKILNNRGYKSEALGNIGKPPSEFFAELLEQGTPNYDGFCILELSSFQLDYSKSIRPKLAMITSFAPDHLDRYEDLRHYFLSKWSVVRQLDKSGILITTAKILKLAISYGCAIEKDRIIVICENRSEIDESKQHTTQEPILLEKNKKILEIAGTPFTLDFPLHHLRINALMCVLAAGTITNTKPTNFDLANLNPLPHRCEIVSFWKNHPVINDSKSTNLASTIAALDGLASPCFLLLGGLKKPESFSMINSYSNRIKKIYLYGSSACEIAEELDTIPYQIEENLDLCIKDIYTNYKEDPATILFSPACASFDQFDNFNERGAHFKQLILSLNGN